MPGADRNNALAIGGQRTTGPEVRHQNGLYLLSFSNDKLVLAALSIANIVKSSLGPVGLDKMMVDDIGVSFSIEDLKS